MLKNEKAIMWKPKKKMFVTKKTLNEQNEKKDKKNLNIFDMRIKKNMLIILFT